MDMKNLAVLRQLKQAMEKASPPVIPDAFEIEPTAPTPKGWVVKNCRFCKTTKFRIHTDWANPPVMCDGCRIERKTRYKPATGETLFTETKVFHGGAPGGGRRK